MVYSRLGDSMTCGIRSLCVQGCRLSKYLIHFLHFFCISLNWALCMSISSIPNQQQHKLLNNVLFVRIPTLGKFLIKQLVFSLKPTIKSFWSIRYLWLLSRCPTWNSWSTHSITLLPILSTIRQLYSKPKSIYLHFPALKWRPTSSAKL